MESASFNIGKVHIVRIDPGEDVLLSLEQFLGEKSITQAIVLGGYGTLAAYHLHWVEHNKIPTNNLYKKDEGGIEILSMNGLVVEGKPHVHIALSTIDGAFGGHLEEGCKAYVLCELFIGEVDGEKLARRSARVSVPGMGNGDITKLVFEEEG
jgi:uncharacterized protein